MASLEVIALVLTGLSISASILYYTTVLRNNTKAQQMQMMLSIQRERARGGGILRYVKTMKMSWRDYDDFNEKYGFENNPEAFAEWFSYLTQFDDYGYMLKRGIVELDFMFETCYPSIVKLWCKFKPVFEVRRLQDETSEREMFWFQYISEELEKYAESKGINVDYTKET